jgi:sulfotransferase
MVDSGPVGSCYNYIRDAVISGFQDRLLFIDYNKFIMNPERDIKRIYDFLELPYFIHDLKNIPQLIQPDDSVWRYPGLHTVRSEVQRTSPEPIQVLGAELVGRYSRVEPWEQWT